MPYEFADYGEDPPTMVIWDSLVDLAKAYWAEHPGEPGGDYGPAREMVDDLLEAGHAGSVDLLSALASTAGDDDALGFLGAGPVEGLMSHSGHGELFIDELERATASNERLATAIRSVWLGDAVTKEVRRRLVGLGAIDLERG